MTKLCDTCEYLRYCARSGIEEVGCDRYKKDTTTNEEWLSTLNTEQKAEVFYIVFHNNADRVLNAFWDKHKEVFKKNFVEWLKQPHTTIKE